MHSQQPVLSLPRDIREAIVYAVEAARGGLEEAFCLAAPLFEPGPRGDFEEDLKKPLMARYDQRLKQLARVECWLRTLGSVTSEKGFLVMSFSRETLRLVASDQQIDQLTADDMLAISAKIVEKLTDDDGPFWDALREAVEDYRGHPHVC